MALCRKRALEIFFATVWFCGQFCIRWTRWHVFNLIGVSWLFDPSTNRLIFKFKMAAIFASEENGNNSILVFVVYKVSKEYTKLECSKIILKNMQHHTLHGIFVIQCFLITWLLYICSHFNGLSPAASWVESARNRRRRVFVAASTYWWPRPAGSWTTLKTPDVWRFVISNGWYWMKRIGRFISKKSAGMRMFRLWPDFRPFL